MRISTKLLASWAVMLPLNLGAAAPAAMESGEINVSEPLAYVRIFSDTNGVSHFSDEEMPFKLVDYAPPAPPVSVTAAMKAESVVLLSSPSGWHGDWHSAPRKQLMLVLTGELEVEVADGEIRRFTAGAVILVEDTSGKGHVSRVVSDERVTMAAIPLPAE
jgi:quercetin dioxygenase-like cupin family protein